MGALAERRASRIEAAFGPTEPIDLLGFLHGRCDWRHLDSGAWWGTRRTRRFFLCGQPPAGTPLAQIVHPGCWWNCRTQTGQPAAAQVSMAISVPSKRSTAAASIPLPTRSGRAGGGCCLWGPARLCRRDPPGHPQRFSAGLAAYARPWFSLTGFILGLLVQTALVARAGVANQGFRWAGGRAAETLEHLLGLRPCRKAQHRVARKAADGGG